MRTSAKISNFHKYFCCKTAKLNIRSQLPCHNLHHYAFYYWFKKAVALLVTVAIKFFLAYWYSRLLHFKLTQDFAFPVLFLIISKYIHQASLNFIPSKPTYIRSFLLCSFRKYHLNHCNRVYSRQMGCHIAI